MPKSWYLFYCLFDEIFRTNWFLILFFLLPFCGQQWNLIPAWGMLALDLGNATVAHADLSRCLLSPYSIMWLRFVSGCGFSSNPTTSLICSYINTHYTHQSPASNVSVRTSVYLCNNHWTTKPTTGLPSQPLDYQANQWTTKPTTGLPSQPLDYQANHRTMKPTTGLPSQPLDYQANHWTPRPTIGLPGQPLNYQVNHWTTKPTTGLPGHAVISRAGGEVDLLPVSVTYARITDDVQQRLVLAELLDLVAKSFGDVARSRLIREHLRQLVHRTKHVAHFKLNRLRVLLLKWTYTADHEQRTPVDPALQRQLSNYYWKLFKTMKLHSRYKLAAGESSANRLLSPYLFKHEYMQYNKQFLHVLSRFWELYSHYSSFY